jgi:hypothetical protein
MMSSTLTKISILLFYRRLAAGTISNRFLYAVYLAIAFVIVYFITFNLTLYLHCRPFHAFWRQADLEWYYKHLGHFKCGDEFADLAAASAVSITQDFIAVGMPMVLFWRLRVSWKQKLALGAVFGVGLLYLPPSPFPSSITIILTINSVGVCGILRLIFIIPLYNDTYDMTWDSYWAWFWVAVEAHMAVICASAPALYTFFKQFLGPPTVIGIPGHKKSYSDVEGNGPWLEKSDRTWSPSPSSFLGPASPGPSSPAPSFYKEEVDRRGRTRKGSRLREFEVSSSSRFST